MNLKPPDPIEQVFRKKMNDIARLLDKRFNGKKTGEDREVGFFLAVFPWGEAKHSTCNAQPVQVGGEMPGVSEKQFKDLDSRLDRIIKALDVAEDRAWDRHDIRLDDHLVELRQAMRAVARAKEELSKMFRNQTRTMADRQKFDEAGRHTGTD